MIMITLVVVNLGVVFVYTTYRKYEQNLASSEEMISQVLNTLYLIQISSEGKWQAIIQISQTPELKFSLSNKPTANYFIESYAASSLREHLKGIGNHFLISIHLPNQQWLNVNYQLKSPAALMQIFIVILAIVIAFALLFSAWTLVRFTRPLREFKRMAEQLGVGFHRNPIIEYGPAIVRETADAMDQMQQRIHNLLRDKNQMLAAISHDLRTPITRLKLRTQFIQDPGQAQEWLSDLDDMESMINQILTYTKDIAKTEELVDLDLVALIYAISDNYAEQGYHIICQSSIARLPFKGRLLALKRVFTNVIHNATKYAKQISVMIQTSDCYVKVIIQDDGPGIPKAQLSKVFTAFYRVDHARTAKQGGTGLGLAITQDIVHAHKGTIELQNCDPQGLKVIITFPVSS